MSEFKCEVVSIPALEKHPNADTLSITNINGYPVCLKTSDWTNVSKGVYIPVDAQCPKTPDFLFLGERDKDRRIRAKRLRGVFSMGMLFPAKDEWKIGDDVKDILGITKYEEPEVITLPGKGPALDQLPGPEGISIPVYDIENVRKYNLDFIGVEVIANEKIHGAFSKYYLDGDTLHVGSRKQWKKDIGGNASPWYRHEQIDKIRMLLHYLNDRGGDKYAVFGEVYGAVQDLHYGSTGGKVYFSGFDILNVKTLRYLKFDDAMRLFENFDIPTPPLVYRGLFDLNKLLELAEKDSETDPKHGIMEGLVIKPKEEAFSPQLGGRLIAKVHSQRFLLR